MLSLVFNCELRADNIIFMPDEIGENFTIESVNEPHTEIFTACNQNWRLVMPLNEIHIILWNAIKSSRSLMITGSLIKFSVYEAILLLIDEF